MGGHSVVLRQVPGGVLPSGWHEPDVPDEPSWFVERLHLQAEQRREVRGAVFRESLPRGRRCLGVEHLREDSEARGGGRAAVEAGARRSTDADSFVAATRSLGVRAVFFSFSARSFAPF